MIEDDGLLFEWDENKNRANIKKHGVSFEEARMVFYDTLSVILPDSEHSYGEERFLIIGLSRKDRLLTVCHCERQSEGVTRIISAREASNIERKLYGGY